jgi:acetylornithine/N-succinyldiaminopimelate aminotransferase
MTDINQKYQQIDKENYLQTFRRFPITLKNGLGAKVWDVDGKEYIDALAGIAVNNVGHCHPKVVKALQDQAATLMHISNFFLSEPQAMLSKKLVEISGLDRVFFSNSGAESVEGAIKIARKYGHSKGRSGTILSMNNSFHGRTMATIATGKKAMQVGFDPIPLGFKQIPFNDFDALVKACDQSVSAILLELVQGEGGINVADKEFVQKVRAFCDKNDIVLIFDEIQSGVGRTGKWFAKDHYGIQPDIMTLAKGLGGGVPIGAILSNQKVSDAIEFGDHGTTFGGNPLVCAVALAVIETIEDENLLETTLEKGEWFKKKLEEIEDPRLKQVKGLGLMIGVEFDFETKPLVIEMLEQGVIANATAGNILRLVPPLTINYEELGKVLVVLKNALKKIQ